jgi:hypothetical protein
LVDRLKAQGRLKGKQIVIAAMRKLLVLCFGVLKTGKEFDPAMAHHSHKMNHSSDQSCAYESAQGRFAEYKDV